MTPKRFTDEELLALIEGELPDDRAAELRAAVRDGDLELAGRLIEMGEHRDFLREMRIDRADLNPDGAKTPAGLVAAAIAAAERESLVPASDGETQPRKRRWAPALAAGLGLAAIIGAGFVLVNEAGRERPLTPRHTAGSGDDDRGPMIIAMEDPEKQAREEELRRLALELLEGEGKSVWPEIAEAEDGTPGVADPIQRDPIEFAGGTGLSELLSEQDFTEIVTALGKVGVRAEARSSDPLRFAGVDALGEEREFTLEEATALAKTGRLAIVLDQTGRQPGELLAASGATGGYLAGRANRFALFTVEGGEQGPEGLGALRDSELVRELRERTADATGEQPGVLASYSFDAAGLTQRVSDAERVTMLELIAAVTSPLASGADGSRLRLVELPFGGDDEAATSADEDNPFWWLEPEEDWSESATTLVPVVVK